MENNLENLENLEGGAKAIYCKLVNNWINNLPDNKITLEEYNKFINKEIYPGTYLPKEIVDECLLLKGITPPDNTKTTNKYEPVQPVQQKKDILCEKFVKQWLSNDIAQLNKPTYNELLSFIRNLTSLIGSF